MAHPEYDRLVPDYENRLIHERAQLNDILLENLLSPQRENFHLTETLINRNLDLTLVTAQYGRRMEVPEWQEAVYEHLRLMGKSPEEINPELIKTYINSTGADLAYWSRTITDAREILPYFVAIAEQTAIATMGAANLKPQDIGYFYLTTSEPVSPAAAILTAERLGLEPGTQIRMISAACTSTAHALHHILTAEQEQPRGKHALIVGEEIMSPFRHNLAKSHLDSLAATYEEPSLLTGISAAAPLCFFSDGAFGFSLNPNRIKRLQSVYHQKHPDKPGVLETVNFFSYQPSSEIIEYIEPWGWFVNHQDPQGQDVLEMNPTNTTKFFVKFITEMAQEFYDKHGSELVRSVDFGLSHRPSELIYGKSSQIVGKMFGGNPNLFFWRRLDRLVVANPPVVTFGYELARVIPKLRSGDTILSIFYGAGGTGRMAIDQIL